MQQAGQVDTVGGFRSTAIIDPTTQAASTPTSQDRRPSDQHDITYQATAPEKRSKKGELCRSMEAGSGSCLASTAWLKSFDV
jgi:hypothetical protein